MAKIKNKIKCKKDDKDIEISEINITKDMLCPKHLLEAEKEFFHKVEWKNQDIT